VVLQRLDDALPPPPNVLGYFSKYLQTSGFPQVFEGLPSSIGPPVRLPSNRTARRAIKAARGATFRITVPACGGIQLGTGWLAADRYVVTNAHVVAGGREATVETPAGERATATVVLYDKDVDLAVLHLDQSVAARPLQLQAGELGSGRAGATLGYPGNRGGRFDADPAAVQDAISATGRDIYGQTSVTRKIYALRAEVTQGESGGPFVLPGGHVAGVVFAASTTDPRIGYALTAAQVSGDIDRAVGRTNEVSTIGCTH
jgi:S1-C subfamily serine protease